ncbi:tryptophan--tRNA ligase [Lysobacter psychrotolerans]|uniref:Tryptophan--tRNA ligase n=1 Tax=Montanilutibacter psychrotolerans TaxID=1327343 RepID=A0A3M8STJ2_9GAMM|nr:tryptophan--tRNA ligase [Lysobacter psychrotolerans]RNF82190.1 tryptophan--tRNA ligase [Lysobacter psychrotolerans]
MAATRVLTGITTSGTPHLGNYVGAIRPAVAASRMQGVESFYFLADYHALIKVQDPARVQRSTLEIAATWLACGLEPDKVWFYRQSDVPETAELYWLLTCVAGKGLLNRAHAYKAAVDKNRADQLDDDAAITAGLFMYPVLMSADILLFNAHKVPVGRDQVQHIEMARDFAQRFNHLYGEHFTLPEAIIDESVATLPGLDGRKMSKSYDNTIALFAPREQLRKLIFSILTDSKAPGEAKDADASHVFQLYQAFASDAETAAMRQAFADGIGWGDAKQALFERIDAEVAPLRVKYEALMARPAEIEAILRDGAHRLRERHAAPLMRQLREAVGYRDLSRASTSTDAKVAKAVLPVFKQYREADGRFYFKLVDGDRLLLQSIGHASARDAGQLVARLKQEGGSALRHMESAALHLGEDVIGHLHEGVELAEVVEALAQFAVDEA